VVVFKTYQSTLYNKAILNGSMKSS